MNAHTPGPWVAVELPTAIAIKSHMGNVANIQRGSMRDQQQANARLIASAPELKEAVERLLSWVRTGRQTRSEDVAFAQQALAKATGGEA